MKVNVIRSRAPRERNILRAIVYFGLFVTIGIWLFGFVRFSYDPVRAGATQALFVLLGVGLVMIAIIIGVCSALGFPKLSKLWKGIVVTSLIGGILSGATPLVLDSVKQALSGRTAQKLNARIVFLDTSSMVGGWQNNKEVLRPLQGSYPADMNGLAAVVVVDNPGTEPDGTFHIEIVGSVHTTGATPYGSYKSSEGQLPYMGLLGEDFYKRRYTDRGLSWILETIKSVEPDYKQKFVALYIWDSQFRVLDGTAVELTLMVFDHVGHRFAKLVTPFNGTWGKLGPSLEVPKLDDIRRGWPQEK